MAWRRFEVYLFEPEDRFINTNKRCYQRDLRGESSFLLDFAREEIHLEDNKLPVDSEIGSMIFCLICAHYDAEFLTKVLLIKIFISS